MDTISAAWNTELKRRELSLKAGRGPRHRVGDRKKQEVLLYGQDWNKDVNGSSIHGQEFYEFPDLDPEIERVRLMDILSARRKIYRHPGARIRPLRESPRRRVISGGGKRVDMSTGQTIGYVGAVFDFREEQRRLAKIGASPVFFQSN